MRWKKEKPMLNNKQKKTQIFLSLCAICLCLPILFWGLHRNGKYLSWERAVAEVMEGQGYGVPEKFLLEKDGIAEVHVGGFFNYIQDQPEKWVVAKRVEGAAEARLFYVQLIKDGFFWHAVRIGQDYYNTELKAYYNENMEMMLGSCQNPNITEVTLCWGHWLEGEEEWKTYVMGETILPVDENGFFYQEVDPSDAMVDIIHYEDGGWEERTKLIQTVYLEGRDKEGSILFRDGIDVEGRRFVNNEEWK